MVSHLELVLVWLSVLRNTGFSVEDPMDKLLAMVESFELTHGLCSK